MYTSQRGVEIIEMLQHLLPEGVLLVSTWEALFQQAESYCSASDRTVRGGCKSATSNPYRH